MGSGEPAACLGATTASRASQRAQAYHSVATLLLAIAEPQPKVLKQESTMLPFSSTLICSSHQGPGAQPVHCRWLLDRGWAGHAGPGRRHSARWHCLAAACTS